MSTADHLLCAATARWLQACSSVLGALGMGCALVAAVLLASQVPRPGLAVLALALGLAERLLALRTRFDAGLLADLAHAQAVASALPLLDEALQGLKLRAAPAAADQARPLVDRVHGARRLTLQHGGIVLLQWGAVALQLLLATWGDTP